MRGSLGLHSEVCSRTLYHSWEVLSVDALFYCQSLHSVYPEHDEIGLSSSAHGDGSFEASPVNTNISCQSNVYLTFIYRCYTLKWVCLVAKVLMCFSVLLFCCKGILAVSQGVARSLLRCSGWFLR